MLTAVLALTATPVLLTGEIVPPPTTVVMTPDADTCRTRALPLSASHRVPEASIATPEGELRLAEVAAAPSPAKPMTPDPATVVMIRVVPSTRRILWFWVSAMKTAPLVLTATASGEWRRAEVAGPPSPVDPACTPTPAIVEIVEPVGTRRTTSFPVSAM